jgi:hypothetical protein
MASAASVAAALEGQGVTHVVGLPDNTSAPLFELLASRAAPRLVTVTREGEAFAVAAGLWVGGRKPIVLVQNTGLLESGDAIRGTLLRMAAPVVTMVTCRGYGGLRKRGIDPAADDAGEVGAADHLPLLADATLDSVALLTAPTLRDWGLRYRYLSPGKDADAVLGWAHREAASESRPAAVIVTDPLEPSAAD